MLVGSAVRKVWPLLAWAGELQTRHAAHGDRCRGLLPPRRRDGRALASAGLAARPAGARHRTLRSPVAACHKCHGMLCNNTGHALGCGGCKPPSMIALLCHELYLRHRQHSASYSSRSYTRTEGMAPLL